MIRLASQEAKIGLNIYRTKFVEFQETVTRTGGVRSWLRSRREGTRVDRLTAWRAASVLRLDTPVRDSREPPADCRVVWAWERGAPRHPPPGKPRFPPQPQGPGRPAAPLGLGCPDFSDARIM